MNLFKVLPHQSYGKDKQILLHPYTALVGSRLDYVSVVYGSATKCVRQIFQNRWRQQPDKFGNPVILIATQIGEPAGELVP